MVRTTWVLRSPHDKFDPQEEYGNNPKMFTLKIHHGGVFIKNPIFAYVDGKISHVDSIDANLFSVIEVNAMIRELGYREGEIMFYHYKIPELDLRKGVRPVECDADVVEMMALVGSDTRVLELYVEHWVSRLIEMKLNVEPEITPTKVLITEVEGPVEGNVVQVVPRKKLDVLRKTMACRKIPMIEWNEPDNGETSRQVNTTVNESMASERSVNDEVLANERTVNDMEISDGEDAQETPLVDEDNIVEEVEVNMDSFIKNLGKEHDGEAKGGQNKGDKNTNEGEMSNNIRGKKIVFSDPNHVPEPDFVSSLNVKTLKREARLRDQISRYRRRMRVQAAKNVKLMKNVEMLKKLKRTTLDKGMEAFLMVASNAYEHVTAVEGLKKELQSERAAKEEKLKQAHDQEVELKEMKEKLKQAHDQEVELKREMSEKLKQAHDQEVELKREMAEKLKDQEDELKREMEEKLKQAHEEFEQEREKLEQEKVVEAGKHELAADGWRLERESLESELERVRADRRWLIEEGFKYVIEKLHKSPEYNTLLGAVQTKLWAFGAHYGLDGGYEFWKDGVKKEDVNLYNENAHKEFQDAVDNLEQTQFPYVVALSQYADRSIDELRALMPIGMEPDESGVAGDAGGEP